MGTPRLEGPDARPSALLYVVPIPATRSAQTQRSPPSRPSADLVLFSTLGIIVRWSIGVRLLTSAENDAGDPLPVSDVEDQEAALYAAGDRTPLLDEPRSRAPKLGQIGRAHV